MPKNIKTIRPKITFPAEGFIKMQPSLAGEIGRDPAIVLQYFIFLLEGDTKYLLWNQNMNQFWIRKSWNAITRDLYPYFMTDYSMTEETNKKVSFDGVQSRLRRIVGYLCRLELLNSAQFRREDTGQVSTVNWYSLNYPMLDILNGLSVKWDYDSDIGRLNVFSPSEKNLSDRQPSLIESTSSMSHRQDFTGLSLENLLTGCSVTRRQSTLSDTDREHRSTIENKTNNRKENSAAIPVQPVTESESGMDSESFMSEALNGL